VAFLPASFATVSPLSLLSTIHFKIYHLQNFFAMNVQELTTHTTGTLAHYFAAAIPLTVVTAWIITAFQYRSVLPQGSSPYKRLALPAYLVLNKIKERRERMLPQHRVSGGGVGVSEEIPKLSVLEYLEDDENDRKDYYQKETVIEL
jgi:hypothetical protein